MAGLLAKEVDVFGGDRGAMAQASENANRIGTDDAVRRPLQGIVVRPDTYASLSVRNTAGTAIPLKNSSAGGTAPVGESTRYFNFLLVGVSEEKEEKFQAVPTFGAAYGFFYGEKPHFMTFSAVLLDTADFQWTIEWWENYQETLRGTKLTDRRARAYLTFDEYVVEGYILRASTNKNADSPHLVQLQFSMWVTASHTLTVPGTRAFPTFDTEGINYHQTDTAAYTSKGLAARQALESFRANEGLTGVLGALGKVRSAIASAVDNIEGWYEDATQFLYGRTITLAPDQGGMVRLIGEANLAAGSFSDGQFKEFSARRGLNLRLPLSGYYPKPAERTTFDRNIDEYITQPPMREGTRSVQTRSVGSGNSVIDRNKRALEWAEGQVAGVPNQQELMQRFMLNLAGKAAYGALSLGFNVIAPAVVSAVGNAARSTQGGSENANSWHSGTTSDSDAQEQALAVSESGTEAAAAYERGAS